MFGDTCKEFEMFDTVDRFDVLRAGSGGGGAEGGTGLFVRGRCFRGGRLRFCKNVLSGKGGFLLLLATLGLRFTLVSLTLRSA